MTQITSPLYNISYGPMIPLFDNCICYEEKVVEISLHGRNDFGISSFRGVIMSTHFEITIGGIVTEWNKLY